MFEHELLPWKEKSNKKLTWSKQKHIEKTVKLDNDSMDGNVSNCTVEYNQIVLKLVVIEVELDFCALQNITLKTGCSASKNALT